MTVRIFSIDDPATAFAVAAKYLARREPFRSTAAGLVGRTLLDAVRRGHVRFAAEGGEIVGVGCWALLDAEAARLWREEGIKPSGDYRSGDTVALLIGAADRPRASFTALRHMAGLYPGWPYVMSRLGSNRTVTGRFSTLRRRSARDQ